MPNRKPQVMETYVMWMAKQGGKFADSVCGASVFHARRVFMRSWGMQFDSWKSAYKDGWRIVKVRVVEVRETKKGKIGMFGILKSLTKAVVNVAVTPVAIVADTVTMGGVLTDRKESYTATQLKALVENLEDAGNPDD